MKKILIVAQVDQEIQQFNLNSRSAILQALQIASNQRSEVVLLTIAHSKTGDGVIDQIRLLHDEVTRQAAEWGVSFSARFAAGDALEQIQTAHRETNSDMIILGASSSPSTLLASLLGAASPSGNSLPSQVIDACPCEIWIEAEEPFSKDPATIIVVDDLTPAGEAALRAAVGLAQFLQSRLLILHGLSPPNIEFETDESEKEAARARAESDLYSRLIHTDYRTIERGVRFEIRAGEYQPLINSAVRDFDAALLIVSLSNNSEFCISESVLSTLAAQNCSLLVMRNDVSL